VGLESRVWFWGLWEMKREEIDGGEGFSDLGESLREITTEAMLVPPNTRNLVVAVANDL